MLPDDIRETLLAIGKVEWGRTNIFTTEEHLAHLRETMETTARTHSQAADRTEMHGLYLQDGETVLCHTGTSPNSGQHARILVAAWNNLVAIAKLEAMGVQTTGNIIIKEQM